MRPLGLGIHRTYPYHVPRAAVPVAGGSRGRRDGLADPTLLEAEQDGKRVKRISKPITVVRTAERVLGLHIRLYACA